MRLELVRITLAEKRLEEARHHLLDTNWNQTAMPELATLGFLALQVGEALLDSQPSHALQALRLVAPRQTLIQEQRRRIAKLRQTIADRATLLSSQQSLWADFHRETMAAMQAQLQSLETSPDYAPTLNLRKALCFSRLERPLEAWILLESLSLAADPELSPVAHLEWISAARQLKAWNASAVIARKYIELYPERNDADQALYWIAQAQIDSQSYLQAIETLQALAARTSSLPLQSAAHYFVGFCHAQQNRHAEAIPSFSKAASLQPASALAAQAQLWIGISQFSQGNFPEAQKTLQAILEQSTWAFLHPEAQFRRIACLYADGQAQAALAQILSWLDTYPGHPREAEAHMLHGDLLRDSGKFESAIVAYSKVGDADRQLQFFALNSSIELQLQLDRSDDTLRQLEAYRHQEIPVAFAGPYYLLCATCLEASGKPEQAAGLLNAALAEFGDNPEAKGILPLIQRPGLRADSEIQAATEKQKQLDRQTLASRFQLAWAERLEKQDPAKAQALRLSLVSDYEQEALPPECLIAAGEALLAIGSLETSRYFERLLHAFPNSEYASIARTGKARYLASQGQTGEALAILETIDPAELPTERSAELLALLARLQLAADLPTTAKETYSQLLAQRQAPPKLKAEALLGIGRTHLATGETKRAYAYFQRVFTLYRGEQECVSKAYLHCIDILCQDSRYKDAETVCREFIAQTDLASQPTYRQAEARLADLQARSKDAALQDS